MMPEKETIIKVLYATRRFLNDNPSASENQVKDHVRRILDYLGWDSLDSKEVRQDFPITTTNGNSVGSADFILFSTPNKKICIIEVENPREPLEQNIYKLSTYAMTERVDIAVITNGHSWWFYLTQEPNLDSNMKKFAVLSLVGGDIRDAAEQFIKYLSKEKMISQKAVELAKMQVDRERAKRDLPDIWKRMLAVPNKELISLISSETEQRLGVRPTTEDIKEFLAKESHNLKTEHYSSEKDEKVEEPEVKPKDSNDTVTEASTQINNTEHNNDTGNSSSDTPPKCPICGKPMVIESLAPYFVSCYNPHCANRRS